MLNESEGLLDGNLLLQMASALPSGLVVDQVVESVLPVKVERLVQYAGTAAPTNLSARAVAELDLEPDSWATWLPEVLVGLRDPEAVRVLASRADRDWLRWVVHLNPASRGLDNLPDLPPLDDASFTSDENGLLFLKAAPAALGNLQALARDPRVLEVFSRGALGAHPEGLEIFDGAGVAGGAKQAVRWFNRQFLWNTLPYRPEELPAHVSQDWVEQMPEDAYFRDSAARRRIQALHVSGVSPDRSSYIQSLIADDNPDSAVKVVRQLEGLGPLSAQHEYGGLSFENPWLPALVASPGSLWRSLLLSGKKPVTARPIGRALYEVTGDDIGLWLTGCELLDSWEGSIPEWLEYVRALA